MPHRPQPGPTPSSVRMHVIGPVAFEVDGAFEGALSAEAVVAEAALPTAVDADAPLAPAPLAPAAPDRFMRHVVAGTVALVGALFAFGHLGAFTDDDAPRRQELRQATDKLRTALAAYATEHQGAFPSRAELATALAARPADKQKKPYLAALPHNPWGGPDTPVTVYQGAWPAQLPQARALMVEARMPTQGLDLGVGHAPGQGPADHLAFGTLLYDYDANNHAYVCYVVGRDGNRAVLVRSFSNTCR